MSTDEELMICCHLELKKIEEFNDFVVFLRDVEVWNFFEGCRTRERNQSPH